MTGVWVLLATVAVATVGGLIRRRTDGRLRGRGGQSSEPIARLLAELGEQPGTKATLVQFSSAFCRPCVATRRILDEVASMIEGVHHVEVDAEAHLSAVRALGVMRTPTVLVLDSAGREVRRASGQPRKVDLIAAIGEVVR